METKIERLIKIHEEFIKSELNWFETFKIYNYEKGAYVLFGCCTNFVIYNYFFEKDLIKTKQAFYKHGRLTQFLVSKYDSNVLGYGIDNFSFIMLSDNADLIRQFSQLKYENYLGESYMQAVDKGKSTAMYIIQCLIKNDWSEYERVLPIFKNKFLKKNKLMEIDGIFYEALAQRDKKTMEEVLKELVSPKIHKKRNTMPLVNEFISYPAVGYAKLAWYKGIEVEVDSPLVPKEWLPIQPLKDEDYIDYDFVKAFLAFNPAK
jgi:Immunity protein 49